MKRKREQLKTDKETRKTESNKRREGDGKRKAHVLPIKAALRDPYQHIIFLRKYEI